MNGCNFRAKCEQSERNFGKPNYDCEGELTAINTRATIFLDPFRSRRSVWVRVYEEWPESDSRCDFLSRNLLRRRIASAASVTKPKKEIFRGIDFLQIKPFAAQWLQWAGNRGANWSNPDLIGFLSSQTCSCRVMAKRILAWLVARCEPTDAGCVYQPVKLRRGSVSKVSIFDDDEER